MKDIKPLEALKSVTFWQCDIRLMECSSITVWWWCWTAMLLFSRCVLFQSMLTDRPCNPARCNKNTVINTNNYCTLGFCAVFLILGGISPVDDDDDADVQSCFSHPLLCTMSHLLVSSRIKQLYWRSFSRTAMKVLWLICFTFRIQALQRSSALRWVLCMAKYPAARKRSSLLCLWCNALLHLLQHIVNRWRWNARWATAKK